MHTFLVEYHDQCGHIPIDSRKIGVERASRALICVLLLHVFCVASIAHLGFLPFVRSSLDVFCARMILVTRVPLF